MNNKNSELKVCITYPLIDIWPGVHRSILFIPSFPAENLETSISKDFQKKSKHRVMNLKTAYAVFTPSVSVDAFYIGPESN